MTASSQRLHPLSILFLTIGTLKGFILPLAVVVFTAHRSAWDVWALWLAGPMALYGAFRYFTTRYAFADDELVVRSGLLVRNERHIRYSRIQNIETVRNPLHRALGVAEVRVETGGGTEPEARLQVLSLPAIDEMRRRVFEGKQRGGGDDAAEWRASGVPPAGALPPRAATLDAQGAPADDEPAVGDAMPRAEPPRVLVRLGMRDLVVFGLVQNRGGLVIAAVLGLLWQANIFDWDFGSATNIRRLIGVAERSGWFTNWNVAAFATLVGLFIVFLILVRILSIGWAVFRLYGFTLTRSGNELKTSCGLLTTVHGVIPLHRIQLVTVQQAPLQRAFDRVEVRVQTAGGDKNASPSREWLAPMLRRDAVDALLAEVVPGPGFDQMEWRPVDARAARREFRTALRLLVVLTAAGVWFAPVFTGVLAISLAVLAYFMARGRARAFGFALTPDRVACRSGWLWRSRSLARYAKVQAIGLGETPFDRRWKMASISADTAGGGSHRIVVPYLPQAEARAVFNDLGARVNETAFRW
jgi:putative membrane protein